MTTEATHQKSRITALIQSTADIVKPQDAPEMLAMVAQLRQNTADEIHGYYQKPDTGAFVFSGTNGLVSYELELQPHVVDAAHLMPTADVVQFPRRSRFVPLTADVAGFSDETIDELEAVLQAGIEKRGDHQ